jgi:hypothetical protein
VPTDFIMHIRLTRRLLGLAIFAWLVGVASPAAAQPTADEVLAGLGLSADDKQRVLNGEFVSTNVEPVSERDLAVSIVFIVKTSPASQVQSWALFKNPGSAADLAGLTITNGEARTLARASPCSSLNLSRAEIAAFNAVPDGNPAGVLQTLRAMLLARYQAYRDRGLAGIAPYARARGDDDLSADLRKAAQAARGLEKYLPKFHRLLLDYPQGMTPGVRESFSWTKSIIRGTTTYVLQHRMAVADGDAWAVVQRQFFVSAGYNGQQAVAGFLPTQGGTSSSTRAAPSPIRSRGSGDP